MLEFWMLIFKEGKKIGLKYKNKEKGNLNGERSMLTFTKSSVQCLQYPYKID